jgi:cysteine desulfurase
MIYLDSTVRPCNAFIEQMNFHLQEFSLEPSIQALYDLVAAKERDRFVFTSSGAEAVNQVFWSIFLERARKMGKTHIIISVIEDAPTMQCARRLEELGCTVKIAPVDERGQIDVEALKKLINPRTALISVTMAHGTTGVIQPVEEIRQVAKEKGVLLHLDATHAIGKFFFSFDADYLTFGGDKIHAMGGALFAKEEAPLAALVVGEEESKGAILAGLNAAALQAGLYLDAMTLEVARLRDLLEEETGGKALYKGSLRLPNVTSVVFEGVHQDALLYMLQRKGVFAALGSDNSVSFVLSRMTTEEEIKKASTIVREAVQELSKISEAL